MCVVSMVGDHYRDKWRDQDWFPNVPTRIPSWPSTLPPAIALPSIPEVSRADFEALKKEVLEMKEMLKRAIKYDADNGEPNCEVDEKMDLLRRVAKMVGVSLEDIIGKPKRTLRTQKRGLAPMERHRDATPAPPVKRPS